MGPETRVHDPFRDLLRQVDLLLSESPAGPESDGTYADVVSDLLAFLAERMTSLHQERQKEMATFSEWLEDRIGCSIEDLSGKTFVRAYDEQPEGVDRLLEVLEKNHPNPSALDVSAPKEYGDTNPARDRIVRGYERSMARLRPIHQQIELTDGLIDRIVYRLYGLNDEEIELVESTNGELA